MTTRVALPTDLIRQFSEGVFGARDTEWVVARLERTKHQASLATQPEGLGAASLRLVVRRTKFLLSLFLRDVRGRVSRDLRGRLPASTLVLWAKFLF